MDASTSTIFLKLVGHTKLLGDFVVYTAGNFRGGDKVFQLRNAYMSFRNVTVGYTYGGFMDLAALPSTIDFQGPNGATGLHLQRPEELAFPCIYRGTQCRWYNKRSTQRSPTTHAGLHRLRPIWLGSQQSSSCRWPRSQHDIHQHAQRSCIRRYRMGYTGIYLIQSQ